MDDKLLSLINLERLKAGVAPLIYRFDIQDASNLRAKEASVKWSHDRPNGKPYWSVDDKIWGENLAKNFITPQGVVNGWINSELHKKNLLNPEYKGACIGSFRQGNNIFISLEFTK